MENIKKFNDLVNPYLSVLDKPYVSSVLKLVLILYGSLAAPSIPVSFGPVFSNTFFRIGVMAVIAWVGNHDPALALIIAVVYFMSIKYLTKNALQQVADTGKVSTEVKILISGGSGPSVKPEAVVQMEHAEMQAIVAEGLHSAANYIKAASISTPESSPAVSSPSGPAPVPSSAPAPTPSPSPPPKMEAPVPASTMSSTHAAAPNAEQVVPEATLSAKPHVLPKVPSDVPSSEQGLTQEAVPEEVQPYMADSTSLLAEVA